MAQRSKSGDSDPDWSSTRSMQTETAARADAAAHAVLGRHLHRLARIPGTAIAAVAWPRPGRADGLQGRLAALFPSWHYWWQAHLLDLLVDAEAARPGSVGRDLVAKLLRGIHLRNLGRWTNDYYDDMAWLGLAVERARRHLGVGSARAERVLADRILRSWAPPKGGGIPWRTMDYFFNTPANGPGAILMARTGHTDRAVAMCDWMHEKLLAPDTGLIYDGIKEVVTDSGETDWEIVTAIYTYCQGVVLGAEVEALRASADGDAASARHGERIIALLGAIETHLLVDADLTVVDDPADPDTAGDASLRRARIVPGAGGGDGGLFAGILVRYLALIATDLPDGPGAGRTRSRAAQIVLDTAEAVWQTRAIVDGAPLFSADWRTGAVIPTASGSDAQFIAGAVHSSQTPERDLSVQLSGWMALEAAARVAAGRSEY
ncbi:MAG TPA: glycoside hydrolase family 76 protein [Gordonia sp. (in: high G+C Gram-positive bacteria)]|uniref:glycoside hydrolase family 76 protein n=2 Tax=Gordonia TaxID=2053 RepID=UPI000FB897A3|nr:MULTISPECIES: glycoside hydrolase family 76 protein [unclassified Gordonia (in: high G+C Gram-positive bacteria)]RUP39649.1 MAG: fructose-bisphosphate aldolase [Gordonia sp. (in: high G+C Gram-positive bacteria)]HNP56916.1 glycoside hydrolase family 76 protein [Gordonia sp. (in: high G+C Gram-positive bacteria)]HRC51167.1 glycoside hydrolase family 76 protein [Gordonia sp. (in: high G+C Gram-positive bacteria)]